MPNIEQLLSESPLPPLGANGLTPEAFLAQYEGHAVSYTHLTLPTTWPV